MEKNKVKKVKSFNIKSFVIATLRKSTYRLRARTDARNLAKIARNQYVCKLCKNIFGRSETIVDHIIPVVDPVKGWQGWDSFIERLYVEKEGLQLICKPCHKNKTQCENKIRKFHKDAAKKKT